MLAVPVSAATLYPAPQHVIAPDPEPTFPPGFDTLSLPTTNVAPLTPAPQVAEWTKIGNPGDIIALTGVGFVPTLQFRIFSQTKGVATFTVAAPSHVDSLTAAFVLPSSLPPGSEYLIWPVSSAGAGVPFAVNATDAWWLGPNVATRGDKVSVYGRNLTQSRNGPAHLYIQKSGEAGAWLSIDAANPYKVDFTVPKSLANGDYLVWAHNGHGVHFGWSGPLTLTINDGMPWSQQVFNVKDFGAKGDSATDDEAAIQAACHAASAAPWSTIYLPAGTYMVSRGFTPPSKVRWKGDGPTKTILKANSAFVKPTTYDGRRYCLLFSDGGLDNLAFQDMTLDANGNMNGYLQNLIHLRSATDVRFENVTMNALGFDIADFHNDTRLRLKNCNATGKGFFFGAARQVVIEGCNLYGTNDANTLLTFWGATDVSCTNTSGQDFDPTRPDGCAQGRFFYGSSQWGSNRDVYVGDCATHALATRPAFSNQNSGEQVMWENGTKFSGIPMDATATTVTFPPSDFFGNADLARGAFDAVIVNGTGLGQHRPIVSCSGNTVTVSPAWNLPPDRSSTVIIAGVVSRCAVYHNSLDGKSDYATRDSASAGIQPYGNSFDFIADGNTISQIRHAISFWGLAENQTKPQSITCVYFNYIANNTIRHCVGGIAGVSKAWGDWPSNDPYPGITILGNTCTHNSLDSATECGLGEFTAGSPPGVQFDLNAFDHNIVTNSPRVLQIDGPISRVKNNLLLGKTPH